MGLDADVGAKMALTAWIVKSYVANEAWTIDYFNFKNV